jgi:hypothetical protein
MAISQNGWSVLFSAPEATMKWITGRIRGGDVEVVFDYLCSRLNELETNKQGWSWGWAVRAVRGQVSGYSNHASATAIDYNAPAHPLGVAGTWSEAEKKHINGILAEMNWIIRWGENYTGRKDGMHFEINKGGPDVKRVADRIRNKQMPDQKPSWKPRKAKAVHFGRVQEQFLIAAGAQRGKIVKLNGVGLVQRALNRVIDESLVVDGLCGEATLNAWGKWEERVGGAGRPRVPDRESFEKLANRANLSIVGEPWD